MIKYVLFDLDGTLTNPKEGITKCVQYALKCFGIDRDCDELVSFIGPPLTEQFMSYANLCAEDAKEAVRIYRERFAPIGIFENEIYDGILDMLKALKEKGITIALATSKPTVFAEKIVKKYGIAPYLDYISGSELDGTNVEKAKVIENALKAINAEKEKTVMVGDRMHDFEGARINEISCVGVCYGFAAEGELEAAGAEKLAATPKELLGILLEM